MDDASAGFVVMLAGAAMTLIGVFFWERACVAFLQVSDVLCMGLGLRIFPFREWSIRDD